MIQKASIEFKLVVLGLAGVLGTLAASGCSGKSGSNGKATNAGSSASDSGGSSNGGGSNGGEGGTSGNSTGATGGSAGTDATGGAAGEAGGDAGGTDGGGKGGTTGAMGGMSGAGASGSGPGGSGSGPGGSGGSSGAAGSGGSGGGSAGMTGTLGTPCSPRGALACAGNHQKLTVLCGGDDTWQSNLTCGDGQFCDSTPGPNVGTCRPELPECAAGPGTKWCEDDDKTLTTCGPDAVSTVSAPCDGACKDAVCRDVSDCPVWTDYDEGIACSRDCGTAERNGFCNANHLSCTGSVRITFAFGPRAAIRTPWADEPCTQCSGTVAYMAVQVSGRVRVSVPQPWRVSTGSFCGTLPQCAIVSQGVFYIVSSSLNDGPVNVLVESVDSNATCPTM